MTIIRYISHPESAVDPTIAVTQWALSPRGLERARRLLDQPWVPQIRRVVTSPEAKAIALASLLGEHLRVDVEVRESTGEIDRSSTGFVPADRHEHLADQFFAEPAQSVAGWETAAHAQRRVVTAFADLLAPDTAGDIALVGHGGVGTLLMCALADLPIDRVHDQPGQGHYWSYDTTDRRVMHRWEPIDAFSN